MIIDFILSIVTWSVAAVIVAIWSLMILGLSVSAWRWLWS